MKLSVKISLSMGMVVLASTIAMLFAIGLKVRGVMENACLSFLSSEASTNAYLLKTLVDGQTNILEEIAARARVRTMDWKNIVQPSLKPDVARLGALDLAMATPEGTSHYVVDNTSLDVKDRSYFKRAMAGEKNVETLVSRITGKLVAMFAVPIMKNDEKNSPIIGVLIARKDGVSAISELVMGLKTSYKSGFSFLIDREGTIIAHKNQELVSKQFNPIKEAEKDPSLKSFAEIVSAALKEKNGHAEYSYNGKTLIGVYSEVPGYPWIIFINTEKQEIEEDLSQINIVIIWIGFICLVIAIIVAIAVGKSIAKPVVCIADALKYITRDEVDLTKSIPVQSKDETGDLARYFNKLISVFRIPIGNAKEAVGSLVSASEELSSVSKLLAHGSEETVSKSNAAAITTEQMSTNINAMASGAEQASVSTGEVADAVAQVSTNINAMASGAEKASVNANQVAGAAEQMSANMNTIADSIEEMSASISQISANARDTRKIAGDAANRSREATEAMNKLNTAAKEIGHVTDVIKKIADKTNLLALNATIEAAHAGDAGKGFAVVAGEIKELANQSANSADDIARRIEGIQKSTGEAVTAISNVSGIIVKVNESVESISNHAAQQTKSSNEIASNVAQANTSAKRVAGAVAEVAKGSKDIARNAGEASRGVDRVSKSIGEVAKGSKDIARNAGEAAKGATVVSQNVASIAQGAKDSAQGAKQVNQSSSELAKIADELKSVLSKFRV